MPGARGKPFIIKAASPWVLEQIKAHCPNRYEFTADRDNWEYVYRTADMINLSGKETPDEEKSSERFSPPVR